MRIPVTPTVFNCDSAVGDGREAANAKEVAANHIQQCRFCQALVSKKQRSHKRAPGKSDRMKRSDKGLHAAAYVGLSALSSIMYPPRRTFGTACARQEGLA